MEELALHILDLVQNCVEAGATQINITVLENHTDNSMIIVIEDNGRGMTPEVLEAVSDPFFTTRTTRRVGLGIPLLKAAAEQSNGRLEIDSARGQGTTVKAWFELDHIDRAPLGNMADTLAAVFAVHSHVDLVYRHAVNEQEFVLDSKEIRDICGEALNHPRIIQWLKEYISEHEKQVGGEQ